MSHCPPITLEGISAEQYRLLLETAQAQGMDLRGESGSTSYQGMDFTWNYEAGAQRLTIVCTNKPIFVPCGMIETRIRGLAG
jgi:hypothetical protein